MGTPTPVCEILVVDAGGFLRNAPLQDWAQQVVTLREVVAEIRDKATRARLQVLPYELQFREPDTDDIKWVTDFAKKTGDYISLSATDIKVLALTYRLEKERVGTEHIQSEPTIRPTVNFYHPRDRDPADGQLAGFYRPPPGEDDEAEEEGADSDSTPQEANGQIVEAVSELKLDDPSPTEKSDETSNVESQLVEEAVDDEAEEYEDSLEGEEDDDEGWITPSNIKAKTQAMMESSVPDEEFVSVACLTTDFAMQNVLKQMNLHVLSLHGLLIRETKTWILRCYSCFNTTPIMTKAFCPKCGHRTLKRVTITVNADGTQQIHISTRRKLTGKGKKFSLPKPQGGKHAVNPILTADQPLPQQRMSKTARQRTNVMNPDYIAGDSPFCLRDVTSRSAIIGVPEKGHVAAAMYWNKKNPNAVGKNTGNRRKKRAL
eukprot:maker-scaffold641_size121017-snap-gene-0.22 protein:Tk06982 transcript:maker-scaffold641_size121017-snap-gene-0.22-mRNA-1 annotation:"rna-binding protein nob1"